MMREPELHPREQHPGGREPEDRPVPNRTRSCIIMAVVTAVVLALLGLAARMWSQHVEQSQREEIRQDVRDVAPLLDSLEQYRQDHGTYPAALDELAPGYIPSVPAPPFDFTSGWGYASGPENVRGVGKKGRNENEVEFPEQVYVLWVWVPTTYTPLRGLLADALVYHSHEQYARFAYDGVLTARIDGWAYYRE